MMRRPSALLPMAFGLTVAGCTVGPNYQRPELATPPRFLAAQTDAGQVIDRWWEAFGDPALIALVSRALNQNLDLAAADARIAQARASSEVTRAGTGPRLDANASVQGQRLSENGAQLNNIPKGLFQPDLEFPVYRASLDASWELDIWGRQRRENEAATARAESALEGRRDAVIRVAGEVARTYADVRAAETRLGIAKATAVSSRRTLALVQQRVRAGEEANLEANRAASELREAEAAIPALEADLRASLFALDLLIGEQPGAAERLIAATPGAARLAAPLVAAGIPSDLLRRRPDIRRAERDLAAETAEVGVAVADLYPRFSLTGSLGLESVRAGDFPKAASTFWQFGPSLLAPLFDGGRRRAEVRRQRAQVDEALANYKQAVLRALSDVETALIRLARERERASQLFASRAELGRNLDLTRQRYQACEADLLEVLDVERRVARLDDLAAQANARVLTNTIALEKALGGGWATTEQRATVSR